VRVGQKIRWPRREGKRKRLTRAQKWVVYLSVVVLGLGSANVGRAGVALTYRARLPDLEMMVSWAYLAVTGGVWGAVFFACLVGLLGFRRWGRWSTLVAVVVYEIHVWVNHLLFDANEYARSVWPRDLALTLLLLILVWGTLNWPSVRATFKR